MAIIKKFRIKSFKQKKPLLKLENISLSFGKRQILENINFEINKGEIFGMLGPNGVGKSTIFNLVTGLISPKKGSIFIGGEKVNDYPIFLRTITASLEEFNLIKFTDPVSKDRLAVSARYTVPATPLTRNPDDLILYPILPLYVPCP